VPALRRLALPYDSAQWSAALMEVHRAAATRRGITLVERPIRIGWSTDDASAERERGGGRQARRDRAVARAADAARIE